MCSFEARVLFDPGASHSFVSLVFTSRMEWQPSKLLFPLSVVTPLSDELETDIVFPSCIVLVKGRELLVDLVLLDMMDFYVILGIDWLSQHYATLDCHCKVVISRNPGEGEFKFFSDRSFPPQTLISAIMARKMLKNGVLRILYFGQRHSCRT